MIQYACFVEGCEKVCATPQKRRMHLFDKHLFPRNYDFFIVNDGLGKRRSMLRPDFTHRQKPRYSKSRGQPAKAESRTKPPEQATQSVDEETESSEDEEMEHDSSSAGSSSAPETSEERLTPATDAADAGLDEITSSMAALRFVPPSIRFGRGAKRGVLPRKKR